MNDWTKTTGLTPCFCSNLQLNMPQITALSGFPYKESPAKSQVPLIWRYLTLTTCNYGIPMQHIQYQKRAPRDTIVWAINQVQPVKCKIFRAPVVEMEPRSTLPLPWSLISMASSTVMLIETDNYFTRYFWALKWTSKTMDTYVHWPKNTGLRQGTSLLGIFEHKRPHFSTFSIIKLSLPWKTTAIVLFETVCLSQCHQ